MRNTIKILLRTFCLLGFIIGISSCKESVGTVYVEKNYVSPVTFSSEELESGDVKVYLSTNTKDAIMYYTVDGSEPCGSSFVYNTPLTFSKTTIIKAVACKEGMEQSPISCGVVSIVEKKEIKECFICPNDRKSFETLEEAVACCGVQIKEVEKVEIKEVKKYICPNDKKEFDTAEEATECCGVQIQEVEKILYSNAVSQTGTYTVYHYLQGLNSENTLLNYDIEEVEDSQIVQKDSILDDLKKTYTGFTEKLLVQNGDAIYIFYDRNIITYYYETDSRGSFSDNSLTKVITGLYGAKVEKPEPTSSNYYFIKWKTADDRFCPAIYGTEDLKFYALWNDTPSDFDLLGNKKIQGKVLLKTSEIEVITEPYTVTMVDDSSWSSYYGGFYDSYEDEVRKCREHSSSFVYLDYIGVFIRDRSVTLSPYVIGQYEVTQELFEKVMGENPSYYNDSTKYPLLDGEVQTLRPVEGVGFYHAIAFCNKLSILENLEPCYSVDGVTDWASLEYADIPIVWGTIWDSVTCDFSKKGYRLPTEAEWEFAARSGNRGGWSYSHSGVNSSLKPYNIYADYIFDTALDGYVWYKGNFDGEASRSHTNEDLAGAKGWGTHEVGMKKPNKLELYDMSGNVFEYCWDRYNCCVGTGNVIDPHGPDNGNNARVKRGGSWDCPLKWGIVSTRSYWSSAYGFEELGFRIARSL